jgi:hypothetical protein
MMLCCDAVKFWMSAALKILTMFTVLTNTMVLDNECMS